MRPLLIGDKEHAAIAELIAKAAGAPESFEAIRALAAAVKEGRVMEVLRASTSVLSIELPVGYFVSYSHEEQLRGVVCRHLSVSVVSPVPNIGPSPAAVTMIMEAFGFRNRLGMIPTWIEPLDDGIPTINVLEPLDGNLDQLRKPTSGGHRDSAEVPVS